jgi:hypothetical protein
MDLFFNRACIWDRDTYYTPSWALKIETAREQFLNFVREFHLLFVDLLEAVNGCNDALSRIADKLETCRMYECAGINTKHLEEDSASVGFRRSCLAYLAIDVLRSPEKDINTAARVRALALLYNFKLDAIASSFAEHKQNFILPDTARYEPVEDLIPRSFMQRPEEKGGTPHNDLFFHNTKIWEIFEIRQKGDINSRMNLDRGLAKLLQKYPAETVQTLLSILRMHDIHHDVRKVVFHMLVGLSQLDSVQKGELFGIMASYRLDGQRGDISSLQSRIGATTGVGASFGDDGLNSLSEDQLRARLRQTNTYMLMLEEKLAELAAPASTSAAPFADPQGYFKVLGLSPRTASKDFDLLLNACYRTLALKRHPDKGGNRQEFQELQKAYEKLSDPTLRRQYLAGSCV